MFNENRNVIKKWLQMHSKSSYVLNRKSFKTVAIVFLKILKLTEKQMVHRRARNESNYFGYTTEQNVTKLKYT